MRKEMKNTCTHYDNGLAYGEFKEVSVYSTALHLYGDQRLY